jgi:hypothetical protein
MLILSKRGRKRKDIKTSARSALYTFLEDYSDRFFIECIFSNTIVVVGVFRLRYFFDIEQNNFLFGHFFGLIKSPAIPPQSSNG